MSIFKDYRVGTMTLKDLNGIEDDKEHTRVQGWLLDTLNSWPIELQCDGLRVDCNGDSIIPALTFGVYEGKETIDENLVDKLIGIWFIMRIKIVEGKTFGHIMPGFRFSSEVDYAKRFVRIIRAMLTKPFLETKDGGRLSFDIFHSNIIETLDRDQRDGRGRRLWANAKSQFIVEDVGKLNVHELLKPDRPNVRGWYVTTPSAGIAVGKD